MLCSRLFVFYFMACLFVAASAISPCIMCSWPFIKNTTRCKICNAIKAGQNVIANAKKLKERYPWGAAWIDKMVKKMIEKAKKKNSSKRKVKKGKNKNKKKGGKGCCWRG